MIKNRIELVTWLDQLNGATEAGDFWKYEITEIAVPLLALTDAEGHPWLNLHKGT